MSEILVKTYEEFVDAVASTDDPTLVLFTAPVWCGPCVRFEPHWDKLQEQAGFRDYTFVKVDLGDSPEDTLSHWATDKYNILGVPSLRFFDGASVDNPVSVNGRAVVPLMRELGV